MLMYLAYIVWRLHNKDYNLNLIRESKSTVIMSIIHLHRVIYVISQIQIHHLYLVNNILTQVVWRISMNHQILFQLSIIVSVHNNNMNVYIDLGICRSIYIIRVKHFGWICMPYYVIMITLFIRLEICQTSSIMTTSRNKEPVTTTSSG
jgi:hypothetical protein